MPLLSFPYTVPSTGRGIVLQCYNTHTHTQSFTSLLPGVKTASCRVVASDAHGKLEAVLTALLSFQNLSLVCNVF